MRFRINIGGLHGAIILYVCLPFYIRQPVFGRDGHFRNTIQPAQSLDREGFPHNPIQIKSLDAFQLNVLKERQPLVWEHGGVCSSRLAAPTLGSAKLLIHGSFPSSLSESNRFKSLHYISLCFFHLTLSFYIQDTFAVAHRAPK